MVSAHDVAAFILEHKGPMSAMKLQKLVYYSQAWSLVWDGQPLFPERIEAWANGSVIRELYDYHRGLFHVSAWPVGDSAKIDASAEGTILGVLNYYGKQPAEWLSDLTHREQPWLQARAGLRPGERCEREITPSSLKEYYSSLT